MVNQAQKRPRRKKAADRLLHGQMRKEQIMCDYAIAPLDRLAIQMDNKWGIDRLPEIVSPATATKYGAAMAHLNDCIERNNPDETRAAAENCIKGLRIMDAEATAAGQPQSRPDMLEFDLDGFQFAILPDKHWWPEVRKHRPDLQLFSLREVAIALKAMKADNPVIRAVKDAFPKAEITEIETKVKQAAQCLDDELPF